MFYHLICCYTYKKKVVELVVSNIKNTLVVFVYIMQQVMKNLLKYLSAKHFLIFNLNLDIFPTSKNKVWFITVYTENRLFKFDSSFNT